MRIPGWLHAGRSPETVGCRPGRRGVAPRPLAANSASRTPCIPALYKPRDGNRNGRALVWQTSDRLCHICKGYNAQDIVRLGMADSISDVLRKELCLFIHRNDLHTEQISFNVASKGPGSKTMIFSALWFRCELRAFLPVVFGG